MANENSEIPKNITPEQKPVTIITKEPSDPEQKKELNAQKTTQALADETNTKHVLKEITNITETPDIKSNKSKNTKEPSIQEQIQMEMAKLNSYFYGGQGEKPLEIQKKACAKALKEEGDGRKYELEAFKSTTNQLEKYAPKRFSEKLDPNKEIEEQRIPSYMLRVREDGTGADYDPYHKNSLFTKKGRTWELHSLAHHIKPDRLTKPPKAVIKELRDYYTKTKTAEAATKPATNKP
ncbi:hypothetical protein KJ980_06505 [Patescibacteria group bacterium]|nr:hypothetical protein [Patescibacteria group bacterium]MBU4017312.1 hypothetical protein [Patescibacteria group bacterium]MBU4099270.1 hypothetical protein [Patescibacteria group bacterium]